MLKNVSQNTKQKNISIYSSKCNKRQWWVCFSSWVWCNILGLMSNSLSAYLPHLPVTGYLPIILSIHRVLCLHCACNIGLYIHALFMWVSSLSIAALSSEQKGAMQNYNQSTRVWHLAQWDMLIGSHNISLWQRGISYICRDLDNCWVNEKQHKTVYYHTL